MSVPTNVPPGAAKLSQNTWPAPQMNTCSATVNPLVLPGISLVWKIVGKLMGLPLVSAPCQLPYSLIVPPCGGTKPLFQAVSKVGAPPGLGRPLLAAGINKVVNWPKPNPVPSRGLISWIVVPGELAIGVTPPPNA